jgi:uncharacterized protein
VPENLRKSLFKRAKAKIETSNGPVLLDVEIADTQPKCEQGLMFRRKISRHQGMIFLFGAERVIEMWMKNTYIALDIVFIGNDWNVIHIAPNAAPLSIDIISSVRPASRVLEIAAGEAKKLGLDIGDAVSLQR